MAIRLDVNLKELADNHGPKAVMDRLEDLMADATDLLDDVGASLVTSTLHRFETAPTRDGHAWKPSARATREGGQTLVDRGHLRDSITHRADASSVAIGSSLVHAGIHQLGGDIRAKGGGTLRFRIGEQFVQVARVTMPARPYLGISADDEAGIGALLQDHIRDAMGGWR